MVYLHIEEVRAKGTMYCLLYSSSLSLPSSILTTTTSYHQTSIAYPTSFSNSIRHHLHRQPQHTLLGYPSIVAATSISPILSEVRNIHTPLLIVSQALSVMISYPLINYQPSVPTPTPMLRIHTSQTRTRWRRRRPGRRSSFGTGD